MLLLFCFVVVLLSFGYFFSGVGSGRECRYLTQSRVQKFVLQTGFTSCKTTHINERRESTTTHFLQLFQPARFSIYLSIPVCLQNKILSDTLRSISSTFHGSIINNRL